MLHAPVELVWEVWTNPEHIANWWGPKGFTNTIHIMDVAEGGEWRLTMHGPDGKNYPNKSIFLEIVQDKKIVFRHFNPNYIAQLFLRLEKRKLQWNVPCCLKQLNCLKQ
ncbi:MAG: SRPBCC domain-containing protein [Bacteroidota bacterium]